MTVEVRQCLMTAFFSKEPSRLRARKNARASQIWLSSISSHSVASSQFSSNFSTRVQKCLQSPPLRFFRRHLPFDELIQNCKFGAFIKSSNHPKKMTSNALRLHKGGFLKWCYPQNTPPQVLIIFTRENPMGLLGFHPPFLGKRNLKTAPSFQQPPTWMSQEVRING